MAHLGQADDPIIQEGFRCASIFRENDITRGQGAPRHSCTDDARQCGELDRKVSSSRECCKDVASADTSVVISGADFAVRFSWVRLCLVDGVRL